MEVLVRAKVAAGVKDRVEEKDWARAGGLAAVVVRAGTRVADTARVGTVSAPNAARKYRISRERNVHH